MKKSIPFYINSSKKVLKKWNIERLFKSKGISVKKGKAKIVNDSFSTDWESLKFSKLIVENSKYLSKKILAFVKCFKSHNLSKKSAYKINYLA